MFKRASLKKSKNLSAFFHQGDISCVLPALRLREPEKPVKNQKKNVVCGPIAIIIYKDRKITVLN
ncbi:MAG: hypothetical protein WC391_10430 [Methanoregula sp.]